MLPSFLRLHALLHLLLSGHAHPNLRYSISSLILVLLLHSFLLIRQVLAPPKVYDAEARCPVGARRRCDRQRARLPEDVADIERVLGELGVMEAQCERVAFGSEIDMSQLTKSRGAGSRTAHLR